MKVLYLTCKTYQMGLTTNQIWHKKMISELEVTAINIPTMRQRKR